MVAFLEKTDGNAEFHEIIDFLTRSSIHYALTKLKKKARPGDDLDDAMDYMETEDAHDEGTVKDSEETRVSTEDQVSTDKLKVSTDKPNEGTAEPNEGTAKPNKGTAEPKDGNSDESAAPTTVFRDD
ncbi:hypothetical protein Tco_1464323, partial [Tanacetum coccineum]